MDWLALKDMIPEITGLPKDAVHIYAAMLIQLGSAAVFRKSIAHPLPWLTVLLAEGSNELLDMYLPGDPIEQWQIDGSIHDLWNTMLLPTVLFLTARLAPSILTPAARSENKLAVERPHED